MTTNRTIARVVSRPARAASAEAATPVISKATTSGTIVIRSALSHMPADRLGDRRGPRHEDRPELDGDDPEQQPDEEREQDPGRLGHGLFLTWAAGRGEEQKHRPLPRPALSGRHGSQLARQRGVMTRKFFGTDGIRGRTNKMPMTAEMALRIGQAAGAHFLRGDHRHRVVIGKDTRLSGYMMETALIAGFTSVGMDVVMVGPVPTPAVGLADPFDARRPRRDDLGEPQQVRRQRHQAVRPRRLQIVGRGRGGDRGADREGAAARAGRGDRPGAQDRGCARPLHPRRQGDLPARPQLCRASRW